MLRCRLILRTCGWSEKVDNAVVENEDEDATRMLNDNDNGNDGHGHDHDDDLYII